MDLLPPALVPLAAWPQFVTWRLVPSARAGKMDKLPVSWRDGKLASSMDPAGWGTFEQCRDAVHAGRGQGIGFVFTEADPFWFLDIDGALQPNGQWSPLATDLCRRFAGAAVEVSQSGTGLHIIGSGTVPEHGCKNVAHGLELYHRWRFVALTGVHASGNAATDHTPTLAATVAQLFPPGAKAGAGPDEWTTEPVEGAEPPATDDDLIRRALASGDRSAAAAFGGDASGTVTFRDLWEGNDDALAARWPSSTGDGYDRSSADAALAAHLAFWTGKNCERIRDLMYRSALVRDKWELRGDYYLPRTILRACGVSTEVVKGASAPLPPPPDAAQAEAAGIALREGTTEYMGVDGQLDHFRGCVYVRADDRVYTPDGDLLNQSRFNATYGGYQFVLDPQGQKFTTAAWEAFTQNRVYQAPRCHALCFRPEQPSGALVPEEGRVLLNTYVPIETQRIAGDASPFLELVAKLLPNERDRAILLSYMASLVQNPGHKFQWWPVLQGTEGNGKTAILRVLSFAVGNRYTHLVDPQKMAQRGINFNGWIQGNLFVGLEEIHVAERRNFLEQFKAYVTNDRLPLEKKGVDEFTGDNRVNGIMLTNHRDGVPINVDSRRYAIFYTAQQTADDLVRDGMDGRYFPDFYDWLYGRHAYAQHGPNYGLAIVNDYLHTLEPVAEFDPAQLCVRAPETTSTAAALVASRGRAEQEIVEAIEQGRPGFANGWISSKAVDELLDRIRANVPRTKRREMLQRLGYDYHPHLPDGRVNNVVQPDNAKPRLFIRLGHLVGNLTEPAAIAKRYQQDQAPGSHDDLAAQALGGENNS
ncbi:MAG: hypothetical protein KDA41_09935 [Planctomycetales bacterium]|nr:hypothetical protein [Planctomycetales bacterium]